MFIQPNSTAYLASGTPAVVQNRGGFLCAVIVTGAGSAVGNLYDNAGAASGNKILSIPANAAVGTVYQCGVPTTNGIYFDGLSSGPAVTVTYR
jgi:hypothetical protein